MSDTSTISPYIDSYNVDPNTLNGLANIPDARQSHFFYFERGDQVDPRLQRFLDHANRERPRDAVASFISGVSIPSVESGIYKDFIEYLIEQPGFVDYIVSDVLPKKHGVLGPELREEITKLLKDPNNWLKSYSGIGASWTNQNNQRLQNTDFQRPHVDTINALGALRLTFGNLPTVTHEGWFEHVDPDGPMADSYVAPASVYDPHDGLLDERVFPSPDEVSGVAFEAHSGVHEERVPTAEEYEKIGGERVSVTPTFEFDDLVRKARNNIAERGITTSVEIRGAGTQPGRIDTSSPNQDWGR